MRAGRAAWPAELERARLWYEPHLERIHEDAIVRLADLIQLEQIASGYPSRERFLTELTLDPPDATSDQAGVPVLDEDYLILSTIHSAKGPEWKSVFVLNVVDGCIPSDLGTGTTAEIEEERRLLYVAMTRAKDLGFSACLTRQVGLLRPALPRAPELKACASMSAPACDGCGDERKCIPTIYGGTTRLALIIIVWMHPNVRRDLARFGQVDHVYRWPRCWSWSCQ